MGFLKNFSKQGQSAACKGFLLLLMLISWLHPPTYAQAEIGTDDRCAVAEITQYPFTATVLDQSFYQRYDSRRIAASLVERKRLFERRWESAAASGSAIPLDAVEIISFFPSQVIESIIRSGQLNLHQVGSSRGVLDADRRSVLEDSLIGIALEQTYNKDRSALVHFVRPKYGLVNFLKPLGVYLNPAQILTGYGEIIAVYHPDVKWRTTYTYGDSMSSFLNGQGHRAQECSRPIALVDLQMPDKEHVISKYVEAQVWGAIDLSDIQEFRVPDGDESLVERLKPAGVPVYSYDRKNFVLNIYPLEASQLKINRGKLLYTGDGQAQQRYEQLRKVHCQ